MANNRSLASTLALAVFLLCHEYFCVKYKSFFRLETAVCRVGTVGFEVSRLTRCVLSVCVFVCVCSIYVVACWLSAYDPPQNGRTYFCSLSPLSKVASNLIYCSALHGGGGSGGGAGVCRASEMLWVVVWHAAYLWGIGQSLTTPTTASTNTHTHTARGGRPVRRRFVDAAEKFEIEK